MPDPGQLQKIAAHRGLSGRYPENTMLAFDAARQAGVRWIETDISMLKDESLILFHDEVQGRTVAGDKRLCDAVWPDFADADAGVWKAPEFAGQTVLRLAEFLDWAQGFGLSVNLEIKTHGGRRKQTADRLAAELARFPVQNSVISSFDLAMLSHLREHDPSFRLASIHDSWPPDLTYLQDVLAIEAVHLDHRLITGPDDVRFVQDHKLCVRVWTVNDPGRAEQLFNWGVDMVMSDYPDRLLAAGLSAVSD